MKPGPNQSGGIVPLFMAVLFCALLIAAPEVSAAEVCPGKREVGVQAMSEFTWRRLNAIREAVVEERYVEARDDLSAMLEQSGRDDYLAAVLNQALGQVEWARKNFNASLPYYERAIELDALPDDAHFALLYQVVQLYAVQDRLGEALDHLDQWFCGVAPEEITAHPYVLRASILLQQNLYSAALQAIDRALGRAVDSGSAPQEAWYQLKLAAHYELEQYAAAAVTLEQMIARWADRKRYWLQLSQAYLQLRQDDGALAVLALAYRRNLLDAPAEIRLLSDLYAAQGVPFRAAQVLESGMADRLIRPDSEHWTRAADHWFAAQEQERALAAYARAAAQASNGIPDLRRGYLLAELERWPDAVDALGQSLGKGGLDATQTGEALLLRGMAHFNLEQYDRAIADWERAARYEKSRQSARQWITHMRETLRQAAS